MEIGAVKFFDNRDNKRFGFITIDGGGEIFFHFNDGENIEAGNDGPRFCGGKMNREPKKGDIVVFESKLGYKGPKAAPWGFEEECRRAKNPKMYRVLEQYTTPGGDEKSEPKILWEGSNIRELCHKYPRWSDRRMDDLKNFYGDGYNQLIWFEALTERGWKKCVDPRPVADERERRRR